MSSSTEVKRGDFLYRDTLFVDLGSGRRHPRAGESELRDLLLPTGKTRGPAAAATKDQVAHWYEAQLLHYGLARTKDKNLAKVRLTTALAAVGVGRLQVPEEVTKLEASMRREWMAGMRKAGKGSSEVVGGGRKRKAVDEDERVQVVGGKVRVTVDVDLPGYAAAKPKARAKKPKTEPAARAKSTATSAAASKKQKSEAAPARGASSSSRRGKRVAPASTARSSSTATGPRPPTTPTAWPKQTARRSAPFMANNPSYRPQPRSPSPSPAAPYDEMDMTDCDNDGDAPPPYESLDFHHSDSPRPRQSTGRQPAIQISGHYEVAATVQGSPIDVELVFVVDPHTRELWGSMTMPGKLRCIIHVDAVAGVLERSPGTCSWRAEDSETGQYLFRRDNSGVLGFDRAGYVSANIHALFEGDDLDFQADLTHGYDMPSVDELRGEWDAIPRRAYGRR